MKPLYEHDCNACVFQGTINDSDIYICPGDLLAPTVVVRHSSDGPDYSSTSILPSEVQDCFNGIRIVKMPGMGEIEGENIYLTVGLRRSKV